MTASRISWVDFKAQLSLDLAIPRAFIYRGQRDAAWTLRSTLHRTEIFADSILEPEMAGNLKLVLQQGCFTWSTISDVEEHIMSREAFPQEFLTKYEISAKERPNIMRELSSMGITAIQIMPSVESACKKAWEDFVIEFEPYVRSGSPLGKFESNRV